MNIKRLIIPILTTCGKLLKWLPEQFCVSMLAALVWLLATGRGPRAGLRLLLKLNNQIYAFTGRLASDYDGGLHPKHRLMKYHDFFVNRLVPGETVIDIGCGNGALSYDMAERGETMVTGIELNKASLLKAKEKFTHERLRYVHGDVLKDLPDESFDVAVMSNVLEHLLNRVEFLGSMQKRLKPKRWLIRVPLYDRDWRVPLMEELGVDYRLDPTHYVEYTMETFAGEVEQAGLEIVDKEIRWGEIWSEVKLKDDSLG